MNQEPQPMHPTIQDSIWGWTLFIVTNLEGNQCWLEVVAPFRQFVYQPQTPFQAIEAALHHAHEFIRLEVAGASLGPILRTWYGRGLITQAEYQQLHLSCGRWANTKPSDAD